MSWLSTGQAAKLFGVTSTTIANWCEARIFRKAYRIGPGKRWRLDAQEVRQKLEENNLSLDSEYLED